MERRAHEYQRTRFPKGTRVEAIIPISQGGLGEPLPVGTKGTVTSHCDDGRAWVFFDNEGGGHTFEGIEKYVRVTEVSGAAYAALIEQRDRLAAALREMTDKFYPHTCRFHGPQICDRCEALRQASRTLATVEQGGGESGQE